MILYLVKTTLLLGLLLGLYKVLLENEKVHQFKRFYLICSLLIGLTAPMINYELAPNTTIVGVELDKVDQIVEAPSEYIASNIEPIIMPYKAPPEIVNDQFVSKPKDTFPTGIVLFTIYLSVTTLLLIRFGHGLFQIFSSIKRGKLISIDATTLVLLEEPITPQSFLKWIFLNREDYESGKIETGILEHERAHIKQLHSIDVICIELLKAIYWFNPFMYGYKHAVLLNHEFLADDHVITTFSDTEKYRETLLQFASSKTTNTLSNSFNNSTPKRRITMLYKSNHARITFLKQIFTLPAVLAIAVLFSIELNAQTISESSVEELSEALINKLKEAETLSSEEKNALYELMFYLPERGVSIDRNDEEMKQQAVQYLTLELEKVYAERARLTELYLDYARNEQNPSLEELQKKYKEINTNNTLVGMIYNQIRDLHGEYDLAPPPPLPPSPEMILERKDR